MPQIKDIRLEVRVRNNLILSKMDAKGIDSIAELCRRLNGEDEAHVEFETSVDVKATQSNLGRLINMKEPARKENGEWVSLAILLADFFQCMPEDLFSEPQQYNKLERNRTTAELAYSEVQQLATAGRGPATPELAMQAGELRNALSAALRTLTPREERVLRLYYFDNKTFDEIGELMSLSGGRANQIEQRARRKLSHPSRKKKILATCGKVSGKDYDGDPLVVPDEEVIEAL